MEFTGNETFTIELTTEELGYIFLALEGLQTCINHYGFTAEQKKEFIEKIDNIDQKIADVMGIDLEEGKRLNEIVRNIKTCLTEHTQLSPRTKDSKKHETFTIELTTGELGYIFVALEGLQTCVNHYGFTAEQKKKFIEKIDNIDQKIADVMGIDLEEG